MNKLYLIIKHRFILICLYIKFFLTELFCKVIYVQYSTFPNTFSLKNRNFGDDINVEIVRRLSNKKVVPYKYSVLGKLFHMHKYMCIGSVISMFNLKKTIIWGTGILGNNYFIKNIPEKVCAVRGPLTREYFLNHGVDCPPIYGDPALLLPLFYHPQQHIFYRLGIIAHYLDHKSKALEALKTRYKDYVLFIDVTQYGNWKLFIDKVISCEFIISSSLHGLIVSDAFGIPNCWCEFDFKMDEDGFKFKDYFMSVGRNGGAPYRISGDMDIQQILDLKQTWEKPNIDVKPLLDACPFIQKN